MTLPLNGVFKINNDGILIWKIRTSFRNDVGSIAGNKNGYVTHDGIKYKCKDIISFLKGETDNPHLTMNKERGRSAYKEKIKNTRIKSQDNPFDYFKQGKEEYLILSKIINKHAAHYSKCSPCEYEDLQAEGWLGAVKALNNYNLELNSSTFKTYAYQYLIGYMKNMVVSSFKQPLTVSLDNDEDEKYLQIPADEVIPEIQMSPHHSQIYEWKLEGVADLEIAKRLNISRVSLLKIYQEMRDSYVME